MAKRILLIVVGCTVALSLGAIAIGFYLAFFFPKTVAVWQDQGRALSVFERLLVSASQFCSAYGVILLPVLLLAMVAGVIVFFLLAAERSNQEA